VGSLERRVQQLEDLYNVSPDDETRMPPDREAALRELSELRESAIEKAEREAAEGDYRRLNALRDLEESVRRRLERAS
jgi:hypothetical protein